MYDVSQRASFDALGDWLIEMRSHMEGPASTDCVIFAVCANKVYIQVISELILMLWCHLVLCSLLLLVQCS